MLTSKLILAGTALVLITSTFAALPGIEVAHRPRQIAVEIRSYNLKPGTRSEFHRLFIEEALPLLKRWKVDVVAYGPSLHDDNSYYLIRAFESLADRQRSEDEFYGSAEWREGPRAAILALIESYTTIVLDLDRSTLDGLRAAK
jgi:hypothetical protein